MMLGVEAACGQATNKRNAGPSPGHWLHSQMPQSSPNRIQQKVNDNPQPAGMVERNDSKPEKTETKNLKRIQNKQRKRAWIVIKMVCPMNPWIYEWNVANPVRQIHKKIHQDEQADHINKDSSRVDIVTYDDNARLPHHEANYRNCCIQENT